MGKRGELHPQARAFLEIIERPGAPLFHALSVAEQREASTKLHFAFRRPAPAVGGVSEAWMSRPAATGGDLRFRAYRPLGASPEDALPVLVYFHGGGWTVGNIDSYDVLCRELANKSRCAVVSVAYRLAPEHKFPVAVDDALFAVGWVADNAQLLCVDGQRIAVGGDSAGGNLATVAALLARERGQPRIAFQLLIYPATDQRGGSASHADFAQGHLLTQESIRHFQRCYLRGEEDRLDWRASPLLAPRLASLPPALILTASHDPLIDDCEAYAKRLAAEGVDVTYSCYEGMIHGFFTLGKSFDAANAAVDEAARTLARYLRGTAQ